MDRLDQYKKGLLSEEELSEFTDTFMRAKHDNDRKTRWQNILGKQHQLKRTESEELSNNKTRRIYLWMASAAAAAAIIAFMLMGNPFATSGASYEQLADAFLSEEFYENQEITKGDQATEQLNLQAIVAYNEKDFSTAIGLYETIVAKGTATDEHHFFLGLSYLYTEQYDAAILNLLKVTELNSASKFLQETRWFLALSYLKNKDLTNGKATLSSIASGMWNYEKAQQLLKIIDE